MEEKLKNLRKSKNNFVELKIFVNFAVETATQIHIETRLNNLISYNSNR